MDFSLSRVIEMFEERFGRVATTALVGIVALALACVSLKTIFETAVLPSFRVAKALILGHQVLVNQIFNTPNTLIGNIVGLVATLFCVSMAVRAKIGSIKLKMEATKLRLEANELISNTRRITGRIDDSARESLKSAQQHLDNMKAFTESRMIIGPPDAQPPVQLLQEPPKRT